MRAKILGDHDQNISVSDTKVHYQPSQNPSFDFGIDKLLNEQYFLFHPFPGQDLRAGGEVQVLSWLRSMAARRLRGEPWLGF